MRDEGAKATKGIVEHSFVDHRVEIADEEFGAYFDGLLLVGAGFVDSDGLAIQAHLVHDRGCIVGVFFRIELDEAIALVRLGDAVFGKVDVGNAAGLEEELPDQRIGHPLVEVADVDGAVFVLLPVAGAGHGKERSRGRDRDEDRRQLSQ